MSCLPCLESKGVLCNCWVFKSVVITRMLQSGNSPCSTHDPAISLVMDHSVCHTSFGENVRCIFNYTNRYLIPRPSHRPVFDCLQKRKEHLSHVYVCRWRVPDQKDASISRACSCPKQWTASFSLCERLGHQCLDRHRKATRLLFGQGPLTHLSRCWHLINPPSVLFLHTVSDQKLDGWKAWEWG